MDRKRIIELSKKARAEMGNIGLESPESAESQKGIVSRKGPESQIGTKTWKTRLGWEWLWFACAFLGSWLLANIFEFYIPAETVPLAIGIFICAYAARLTIWSIKEMGK